MTEATPQHQISTEQTLFEKLWYRFCQTIFYVFGKIYFRLEYRGLENMPQQGAVLVVANHASNLDPPLIGAGIKRPMKFLAKSELFEVPLLGRAIDNLGAFPVHRGAGDREALRLSLSILDHECPLIMFPEGSRSEDGTIGEAQAGVSMMVYRKPEVTILPVRIDGSYQAFGKGMKTPKPHKITITVGKPFKIDHNKFKLTAKKRLYQEIGIEIMRRIRDAEP